MDRTIEYNDIINKSKKQCSLCASCNRSDKCNERTEFEFLSRKIASHYADICDRVISEEELHGNYCQKLPFTFISIPVIAISGCNNYEERTGD